MIAIIALSGCSSDRGSSDTSPADIVQDLVDPSDASDVVQPELLDDAEAELGPDDKSQDGGGDNEFGFTIRLPEVHTVKCEGGMPGFEDSLDQLDQDWLCTFDYGDTHGHVYVQATVTSCFVTMSQIPEFEVQGAWISIDGQVEALANAYYDWGGNHQNDYLEFERNGEQFKYYHASFGPGWRACQNMHCLQVKDLNGDFIENGCTTDRTLPAACVQVKEDGTYDELVDTFEPCEGDDNY